MPAAENDLDFEWEVREDGIPYRVHMMGKSQYHPACLVDYWAALHLTFPFLSLKAGCLAGMVEHSTMFPFDNIKVHIEERQRNGKTSITLTP